MKWPKVKLMQILTLEYGSALKEADRTNSGNCPVVGSNGVVGYHDKPLVDGPGVVVGRKGSAGKVTWIKEEFWPIDTTYYVNHESHVDIRWIFYLLNSLNLERFSIVTGVPGLNRNDVYNLTVHLPPFSEQRRIVEILDQADALRRKRAEADAKAERVLLTLFLTMFGHPLTNAMRWPEVTLDSCSEIVTGNTPSTKIPEYYDNDIPWARPADLDNQIFVTRTEKMLSKEGVKVARLVPANSVLVVCIGATLGKAAMAGIDMTINQQINAVLPCDSLLPEFLYIQCILLAVRFRAAATMSTLPILNKSQFGNQKVICPPNEKQQAFVRVARLLISNHDNRVLSKEGLQTLFCSLLHMAFTGDLTARWRTLHVNELLGEIHAQTRALISEIKEVPSGN